MTTCVQGVLRTLMAVTLVTSVAAAQFAASESDKVKGSFYVRSFGEQVAADGDVVVVGSPLENLFKGKVYVYRDVAGTLVLEQEITNPAPQSNDLFGDSISVSGDVLAIGAPGDHNFQFNDDGEAFVYRFDGNTWQLDFSIVDRPLQYGDGVAVDGDLLVVGDPGSELGVLHGGALEIFRYDGAKWEPEATLRSFVVNGFMGDWLDVEDDWIFAGTSQDVVEVYHFNGSAWTNPQTLLFDNRVISMDGDLAVIGQSGGAPVLRRRCDTWELETTLTEPVEPSAGSFAGSVSVSGDAILVGNRTASTASFLGGSAHVFRSDGADWVLEQTLLASDSHESQHFGNAVALSGDRAVIGARQDDETWRNSGAAYLFNATPQTPRWQDLGSGLSGDETPELFASGTLLAGESVSFATSCAQASSSAALFIGLTRIDAPFKGGVLVPDADVLFTGLPVDGNGELVLGGSWPAGVPAAFELFFQLWITDAGAPVGLSATNAVLATTP